MMFERSKIEATFFSKRKNQRRRQGRWAIQVGKQKIRFAEAARWPGVWVDSELTLAEN